MMRKTFQLLACVALLAAPLAFTAPAFADNDDEIQAEAPPTAKNHEQWEQLRNEHSALVAERDRLMERCMDVKGQDKSACDDQWSDLRERHEAWRERMMAFHQQNASEKAPADHKMWHHHHKGMKGKHEEKANAQQPKGDAMTMKHHHHHHHNAQQGNAQQPAAEPAAEPAGQ